MSRRALRRPPSTRRNRTALRVAIHDGDELETDHVIAELLGKDAGARFRFIIERAGEVDELDV